MTVQCRVMNLETMYTQTTENKLHTLSSQICAQINKKFMYIATFKEKNQREAIILKVEWSHTKGLEENRQERGGKACNSISIKLF